VLAPGARADINVLAALDAPTPRTVVAAGRIVVEGGRLLSAILPVDLGDALSGPPLPRLSAEVLSGPDHRPPGLRFVNTVITELLPSDEDPTGIVGVALVDRRGRWITRSRIAGFATRLGGLATSFTSGFDVAVLGQQPQDMEKAMALLADDGGGIVIVEDGEVVFRLPFDLTVWSSQPWPSLVEADRVFQALLADRGYRFTDPIYSLLFLTFDSLPWIRVTARGIWDVRARQVLEPATRL
jgi:adenine deaminase